MEFFSFFQCTVSKTETVTIQTAIIGASCTSQTKWIQLNYNCSRPWAAVAILKLEKQEPDGSPYHSFSILGILVYQTCGDLHPII